MEVDQPPTAPTSPTPAAPPEVTLPAPVTERGCHLRAKVSAKRWRDLVIQALARVELVKAVKRAYRKGERSLESCLAELDPEVHRSTYLHWVRKLAKGSGHEWERLLDARVPPSPPPIPEGVRTGAELLRRVNPTISCETARAHLVEQLGEIGRVCDTSLRRIWRAAGLRHPGDPRPCVDVELFPGGALLALVGAAATESRVPQSLAQAALDAAHATAADQEERGVRDVTPGRDDRGRFTKNYNAALRNGVGPGSPDGRWLPDAVKRAGRDLSALQLLNLTPETLGQRFLAMGLTALLTGLRGFDGLDNPRGPWMALAGGFPYRAATMDKTLTQLALLNAGEAMWTAHGEIWVLKAREWSKGGPRWLQVACYVDINTVPHWTDTYSLAGKVSRTGRVQPCLQRVALMNGPGVPLLVVTEAGTLSLKKTLFRMLQAANDLGIGQDGMRLTIVDAEAATIPILSVFEQLPGSFVTVLKGPLRGGANVTPGGDWISYRKRDQIREAEVTLKGGLTFRGVEVFRDSSRHPHKTLLLTNATKDSLSTEEVAEAYFSRWPNQEGVFREWTNGAGLKYTSGYSGEYVTNYALEENLNSGRARVEAACDKLERAKREAERATEAKTLLRGSEHALAAKESAKRADSAVKKAEKAVEVSKEAVGKLEGTPALIRKRDTTRENIASVLKLSMLMLIEWVLREYFGGLKTTMEAFLDAFLYLPTELRTARHELRYRILTRGLPSKRIDQLSRACEEVNKRKIRRDGRLLRFELMESLAQNHAPPPP